MVTRKTDAPAARRGESKAKPKTFSREQFERLYKSVVRRIPKTLDILAK